MKRRNAETGKMRRTIKRTKITEGMYGNSMVYLKFVMAWASIVMADYLLEFRFEFLFPFWMMLSSVYETFKYQGLAFSVFFVCIALTSDMICFFFMPIPWMFFAASIYVWVQCVWYTVADKGVGLPTVALCCLIAYIEGAVRTNRGSAEFCRPLAAHCVGYPVVTLGFSFKSYVGHRLRLRRQRRVRAENEFYYQLMRDALPESALEEQNQQEAKPVPCKDSPVANGGVDEHKHMNGSVHPTLPSAVQTKSKKCTKPPDQNGVCPQEHANLQFKLDKLEKHLLQSLSSKPPPPPPLSNGAAVDASTDTSDVCKGSAKSSKCDKRDKDAITLKEEKKRNKNKDKDREINDSSKGTDNSKESVKDVESTKEYTKSNNNHTHKERDREREKEKELQREREKEYRECQEELKRVKAELAVSLRAEASSRRALAAATAAERAQRADHLQLKTQHQHLQHKVSTWRVSERTERTERVTLERRLQEERRARAVLDHQLTRLQHQATNGECENSTCSMRRAAAEADTAALRRDLLRARERGARAARELRAQGEQIRTLEQSLKDQAESAEESSHSRLVSACQALQERAAHLERALSSETRVKLDLLSALGEAKRQLEIREGLIAKQEKEVQELKAQMLAVMPTEFMSPISGSVSKLRLTDGSHLDPNASVYTPRQLCSDA